MLSMETMELSTNMPMPSARPDSESTLSVMPVKYMQTNATTTLSGIESAMMIVGRQSIRNTSSTRIASAAPEIRLSMTESMMTLMYSPWSNSSTS